MVRKRKGDRARSRPEPIEPNAIYTSSEAAKLLRVGRAVIGVEVKAGRLKSRETNHQRFFQGAWLLEWLESQRTTASAPATGG